MLQEMGVEDQIIACTQLCPLPLALRQRKAVGSFSALNEAKLAATKPDLIVTATIVQHRGSVRLRAAGFKVLHLDPRRLTEIGTTYAQLGACVGREQKGQELQRDFLRRLTELSPRYRGLRPTVYMEEWHEPPFVAGNWVPDIVASAGAQAVLTSAGQPSRAVTLAELVGADPDIIVQHICLPPGRDWTRQRMQFKKKLMHRPGWQQLRAVRQGRVYSLTDTPFNLPTSGVLEGISLLRTTLLAALNFPVP